MLLRLSGRRSRQSGTHSTITVSGLAKLLAVPKGLASDLQIRESLETALDALHALPLAMSDVAEGDRRRGVDPRSERPGRRHEVGLQASI